MAACTRHTLVEPSRYGSHADAEASGDVGPGVHDIASLDLGVSAFKQPVADAHCLEALTTAIDARQPFNQQAGQFVGVEPKLLA